MKSLWNDTDAAAHVGDVGQRVYSSRLLGRDRSLVLHGGGNTSVKSSGRNVFGEEEPILFVKGSGVDLESIDASGFSPCRMKHLLRLLELERLSDSDLLREFKLSMTRLDAPSPSVEAILHALIPAKFVDHTHSDAVIVMMNTPDGESRVREIFGERVIVVPYVMPGFGLAKECAKRLPENFKDGVDGMVLMHHGLFTWGATARESYERMITLVDLAERYLEREGANNCPSEVSAGSNREVRVEIAALRREVSVAAGAPMIGNVSREQVSRAFAQRKDLASISQRGAATPDHVIRTKHVPLIGRDVEAFCQSYGKYVDAHSRGQSVVRLDPAPRIVVDPELGMCAFGKSASEAAVARDIYRHTIEAISRAEILGGWRPLPTQDLFDMEYWEPQQAKLHLKEGRPLLAGEVALVTGAASGIGRACVDSLLSRGAAVVGLDVNPGVAALYDRTDFKGIVCDLTNEAAVSEALEEAVCTFGGVDLLILNAGIFPKGSPISELPVETWRRVLAINLDANFALMRACHPLLKLAPGTGRVVVIGSKNVHAPGPGASAYSVSKAAVNQLARVAALEWGKDGIRINSIHPNMVFDTALWTPEVLESRARHYGVTVEEYRKNNVLKVEVTSRDVAELAAEMCGPLFAKTTAAQVPVDGGNERVI
jgi:rhamnose utilization protein RhaD (predicted bifunctional aldolase and dehydrogenase)/NAD(P)-dependent dehydrogenase (short-subunit alcohol dehydrogenase family)